MKVLLRLFSIIQQNAYKIQALDGCKNIVEYLSRRLNWNEQMANKMEKIFPPLFKSKVSRVST